MFFVELIEDYCFGGVVVVEIVWQVGVFYQFIQQFLWEIVFLVVEVVLVKQYWYVGDFLVVGWGIFIGRKFMCSGIGVNYFGIVIYICGNFIGGVFMCFYQIQMGQVW